MKPELKQKLDKITHQEPTIRIGKKGITKEQIEEIKKQLKSREIVKIKLLRAFLDTSDSSNRNRVSKQEAALELATSTGAAILAIQGFVIVLFKNRS